MALAGRQRDTRDRSRLYVVLSCSVVILAASGARSSLTAFVAPLERTEGVSRSVFSLVVSVNLLVYAVTQAWAGVVTERLGAKRTMALGCAAIGTAFTAGLISASPAMFFISIGLILGIGIGLASLVPTSSLVAAWFDDKEGVASGTITAARPLGQVVFVPATAAVVAAYGWRFGFGAIASVTLIAVPVVLLFANAPGAPAAADVGPAPSWPLLAIRDAVRDRTFLALAVGMVICGFTDQFVALHLVPFAEDNGVSTTTAGAMFALLSGAGMVGSLLGGKLSDVFRRPATLVAIFAVRAVSLPILLAVGPGGRLWLLVLFAVPFGATLIANVPPIAGIAKSRYGIASTGRVMAWLLFFHQAGGALGTLSGGAAYEALGSYAVIFLLGTALSVLAAVLSARIDESPAVGAQWVSATSAALPGTTGDLDKEHDD